MVTTIAKKLNETETPVRVNREAFVFLYFLILKDTSQTNKLKKLIRSIILHVRCFYCRIMTKNVVCKSNLQLNCEYLRFIVHPTMFITFIVFDIIMSDNRKVLVKHGPSPTNPLRWEYIMVSTSGNFTKTLNDWPVWYQ